MELLLKYSYAGSSVYDADAKSSLIVGCIKNFVFYLMQYFLSEILKFKNLFLVLGF